ncbi:SGNH/GDSL hydrolase family protein [Xanthobacter sp.]|uniref:SGNH/GDSL hydrolase family protein n=1 Tax=Xanthobacter sp. TaxID=35809 RepID=UPI0025F20D36|nr:SGNH/GDSL hydrolase family protein [Xanthobacter sp.]
MAQSPGVITSGNSVDITLAAYEILHINDAGGCAGTLYEWISGGYTEVSKINHYSHGATGGIAGPRAMRISCSGGAIGYDVIGDDPIGKAPDLSRRTTSSGSADSVAQGLATSPENIGGTWNQSTAALKIRLQQALASGRELWTRPHIAPTAHTPGQTVQVGDVRQNSATPAQWYLVISAPGICGATEPTHTGGSAVWDGTATSSVLWTHLGSSADWENVDDPAAPAFTPTGNASLPGGFVSFNLWANRALVTMRGCYAVQHAGSGTGCVFNTFDRSLGGTVQGGSSIAFWSNAEAISFQVPGNSQGIRVYVDGRPVTAGGIGVNTQAGTWAYNTIDFKKRKERLWEVFFGTGTALLYNIAIPSNAQIWPAPSPVPLVGVAIGDSYLAGSAYGSYLNGNTLSSHFGRLIGVDNMHRFGTGGTGLNNPGSGPYYTYIERVPQLLALNPDIVVVQGSTNDASYTQSQVNTAALAFLDAIRAGSTAPVFWFGPAPISGSYSNIQAVDTAISEAVAARPNRNIFYSSMVAPNTKSVPASIVPAPWLIGAHNNTGFTSFSTIGEYIGGDNVHPVDKGTMYLARRMASAYANEMLPLVA